MNILIDHTGFVNKGAELMLCSAVDQLKRRYPTAQLLITIDRYQGGVDYCKEYKILPVRGGMWNKALLTFYKLCLKLKLISPNSERLFVHTSNVDVVIDAGGFRLGDQWKHNRRAYLKDKSYYNSFKRKCKMIFLPQSFGPFEQEYSIKTIKQILKHVGLVFPREETSMQHLLKVAPKSGLEICFKRDFTLLCKQKTYISTLMPKGEYVVFIVNKKMITHSSLGEGIYFNFVCGLIQELHEQGEKIILLNHEGVGDKLICDQICESLNLEIPIMTDLGAMPVKNAIGQAKLVVSSRFHGVVSGITQQVPTLCTSWSHKYNELVALYKLEGNLLDINSIERSMAKIKDALKNPDRYITSDEILEQERLSTEDMWNRIFNFIEQ